MLDNDVIFGKNAVGELLNEGKRSVNKIFIQQGMKFDPKTRSILEKARNMSINVQEVPREKLGILTNGGAHQGIAVMVSPIVYTDLEELLNIIEKKEEYSLVIILDGVEDPHNLGSIIRTSVCAGADGIIIPKRRASQVTSTVEKTSAGAVEKIPITQVTNITKVIEKLKGKGFWIIGAEGSADTNYFDIKYDMNCALVLGSENLGISNLVKKNCDFLVKIPMPGKFNSLNVSNAASILIYEIVRQRIQNK